MTIKSFPAVGKGGFNEVQWATEFSYLDGTIDYVGDAGNFSATVDDAGNNLTFGAGVGKVAAVTVQVTGTEVRNVPTVGSGTVTYWVVLKYDPALNIADGSGNASTAGPASLQVIAGTPPTGGGEKYTTLYRFTRTVSQLLSSAWSARVDFRVRSAPVLHGYALQTSILGYLDSAPIGAQFQEASTGYRWVQERPPGEADVRWVNHSRPVVLAFPKPGSLIAAGTTSAPTAYKDWQGFVSLRGTLKRSNGAQLNNGADVNLGTMPVGWRPSGNRYLSFQALFDDNTRGFVPGYIDDATGFVWMFSNGVPLQTPWVSGSTNQKNIQWISLDNNRYLAEQ